MSLDLPSQSEPSKAKHSGTATNFDDKPLFVSTEIEMASNVRARVSGKDQANIRILRSCLCTYRASDVSPRKSVRVIVWFMHSLVLLRIADEG
jgi:hypothetical protein